MKSLTNEGGIEMEVYEVPLSLSPSSPLFEKPRDRERGRFVPLISLGAKMCQDLGEERWLHEDVKM